MAKLSGGVSVLRVGAATEVELKEKKHRLEDAISATRAAIEEGIIPGGGSALVHIAATLDDLGRTGDEATGVGVVRSALVSPARWIAENAGVEGYGRRRPRSPSSASARASTRPPASTATWWPRASSTRSR